MSEQQPRKTKGRNTGGTQEGAREKQPWEIRVKAVSDPNKVAGSIAGAVREHKRAETLTIGAGALNQAVKAIAIACGFMAPSGVDLICRPAFVDIIADGQERTAIRFLIEPK